MDRQAFEKLALEHLDAVYRMALHLTRRADEAEDLVQEVYVKALRPKSVESFESKGGGMRAWLFAITHNVFYSKLRREKKAPQAVADFFDAESAETPPDEAPPAWDRASLDWEQVDERIKDAVESLSPEYREVLLMWGVEGLKYREIATIMEVPIGTVMSRLHRARKLVSDAITQSTEGINEDLGAGRGPAETTGR